MSGPGGPSRPAVDVVVPFNGGERQLDALLTRLARIELRPDDAVFLVDNRRRATRRPAAGAVEVVGAPERQSSYFARNRGAARGASEWILFLDADVEMPPEILDQYFSARPREETAILAGALSNEAGPGRRRPLAVRYAELVRLVDQEHTLGQARPYAQTANCAIRRSAFEAVGGFEESIRSGGDADLCFRLGADGWGLERRLEAEATHLGRRTLLGMLGQKARHGSGRRWLDRRYPGFARRPTAIGVGRTVLTGMIVGSAQLVRGRRDPAIVHLVGALVAVADWVGYRVPNRPWREILGGR